MKKCIIIFCILCFCSMFARTLLLWLCWSCIVVVVVVVVNLIMHTTTIGQVR